MCDCGPVTFPDFTHKQPGKAPAPHEPKRDETGLGNEWMDVLVIKQSIMFWKEKQKHFGCSGTRMDSQALPLDSTQRCIQMVLKLRSLQTALLQCAA